jgi:hypothetical protein
MMDLVRVNLLRVRLEYRTSVSLVAPRWFLRSERHSAEVHLDFRTLADQHRKHRLHALWDRCHRHQRICLRIPGNRLQGRGQASVPASSLASNRCLKNRSGELRKSRIRRSIELLREARHLAEERCAGGTLPRYAPLCFHPLHHAASGAGTAGFVIRPPATLVCEHVTLLRSVSGRASPVQAFRRHLEMLAASSNGWRTHPGNLRPECWLDAALPQRRPSPP